MFSEILKKWIFETVKDVYKGDINRDIDLFEKSLYFDILVLSK